MTLKEPKKVFLAINYKTDLAGKTILTQVIFEETDLDKVEKIIDDTIAIKKEDLVAQIMILDKNMVKVTVIFKKDPFGAPLFSRAVPMFESEINKIRKLRADKIDVEQELIDSIEVALENIRFEY